MKRLVLSACICLGSLSAGFGQIYSYSNLAKSFSTGYSTSSARMQALGGVHSALGADISSIAGNPAGLGFYNRSEVALGLGYVNLQTQSSYLGTNNSASNSFLQIPTFGLVLGGASELSSSNWRGSFGVGYSRQVLISQPISLSGTNNRSSILDRFIEKANSKGATGQSLDDEYDSFGNSADSPEAVAYQAYLINPNSKTQGAPFERYESNLPVEQSGSMENTGAISQWDISYGAAYKSKLYVGIGVHFSKLNVTSTSYWEEQFKGANIVGGLKYQEQLTTSGSGISATLGMIYKMSSSLRVAISLQTPTYFDQMNERMDGVLTPRVFGIPSFNAQGAPIIITKVGPVKLTPNEFSYQLSTPMRLSGGAAYLLGKKALISLDMEYVNYPGMQVASAELSPTDDLNFQNKYNSQTKKNFQAGINIKAGTEIRLTPSFSLRGGVASFGNSYSATFDSIDRTMLQFSGGVGYRSNQFYVDLTGYQRTGKDAFTPYTLKNTADYSSASLSLTQSQFLVSAGVYF